MEVFHDSQGAMYRRPLGAVTCGTQVEIKLLVSTRTAVEGVFLRVWEQGGERAIPMQEIKRDAQWRTMQATLSAPGEPSLVWYHFALEMQGGQSVYYGNAKDGLGGVGEVWQNPPPSYQITVYDADFAPPAWLREGVMYQIFPDRFFDGRSGALLKKRDDIKVHKDWYEAPDALVESQDHQKVNNDFFGGNLVGIEQKLGYLQSLGVNILYLNPIFRAHSNHKYDTGDYDCIDPTFGEEKDFHALCEAAQRRGMRVVLDGVFSHTGEDSRYFNRYGHYDALGAYQSEASPYYKWYTFKKHPDEYASWWGIVSLPEVNKMEPSYLDFMLEGEEPIVERWLQRGAHGWRLDVADELPDEFIFRLRKRVKKDHPDACIIGEVWEDATNKVSQNVHRQYALGRGLDSVMNYPLRGALIDFLTEQENSAATRRRLLNQRENYPLPMYYSLMNMLGSHDRIRIINILAGCDHPDVLPEEGAGAYRMEDEDYALGSARSRLMLAAIAALPGMPSVYYGDEAGMQGLQDPFCRFCYPWGREDQTMLDFFRSMLRIRRKLQVLRTGEVHVLAPEDDILCIARTPKEAEHGIESPPEAGAVLLIINRAKQARRLTLDAGILPGEDALVTHDGYRIERPGGVLFAHLPAMGSMLLMDKTAESILKRL